MALKVYGPLRGRFNLCSRMYGYLHMCKLIDAIITYISSHI